jgi:hypothetical protein
MQNKAVQTKTKKKALKKKKSKPASTKKKNTSRMEWNCVLSPT